MDPELLVPRLLLLIVEAGRVVGLLACPACSRTLRLRWPYIRGAECEPCGTKVRISPPAPGVG